MMKMARILKSRTYGRLSKMTCGIDNGFIDHARMTTMGQNFEAKGTIFADSVCRWNSKVTFDNIIFFLMFVSHFLSYADRIYAEFNVYKGKAALSASPVLPRFSKANSGGLKVDRRGSMMLTFSPAVGERKYDWERKQLFALSVTEIGSMISLGANDSCEFFHDPSMGSSNAGQVRKSLSVKPHMDGSGYFISLNVVNNIKQVNERFTVPVSSAEFAVMRTAFSFALPLIMGWDRYSAQLQFHGLPKSDGHSNALPSSFSAMSSSKVDQPHLDSEWDL
ncbi:Single-stranded DNA-binding protein why2, mitochondrial [Dionaea muscipula]